MLVVGLAVTSPAFGQSAADKATARRLATEGIELHNQGKYSEALDRLQRAQALYDAPVHLLYIARAQAKLGLLVEASETYRRLARVELDASAPAIFRESVQAGKREAPEVEAKIGALRIEVTPNVRDLKLSIDGQEVSSAIVGVERPANPGRHVVVATAPGYLDAEASVEIGEAEKKTVELRLEPSPESSAGQSGSGTDAGGAPNQAGASASGEARADATASAGSGDPGALHLFVAPRIGAAFPGGSLYRVNDTEVPISDYLKTAFSVELSAGAWFARYFGAKLFVERSWFLSGSELTGIREFRGGAKVTNSPLGLTYGVAAMVGTPPGQYGGFGEVGLLGQRITIERTFELEEHPSNTCGPKAQQQLSFTGTALRIGGGARLPVWRYLHLTPFLMASFGQISEFSNDSECAALLDAERWPPSGDLTESVGTRTILLGVGGDFLFGLR